MHSPVFCTSSGAEHDPAQCFVGAAWGLGEGEGTTGGRSEGEGAAGVEQSSPDQPRSHEHVPGELVVRGLHDPWLLHGKS